MAEHPPVLAACRLLDASRSPLAADDTDVTGYDKANEFIVVAQIDEEKGPWEAQYTLRWRDVTDAGSFAPLAATGEIKWGTDTVLVNGNPVVIGEKACTNTPSGSSWQDGEEVEGAATCDSINLADEYYTEIHFACDAGDAQPLHEYEFQLWDETNGAAIGTLLATITMELAGFILIPDADIADWGQIIETSGGDIYFIADHFTDSYISVWKKQDGSFSRVDYDTHATVFGGGGSAHVAAALDSNDDIHVVAMCSSVQTRDVAYCVFDTGTDQFGTWEEAAPYTAVPTYPRCEITIDSADKPWVIFTDQVGTYDQIYSTYKDGTWQTPERVNGSTSAHYRLPMITCCPDDHMEAVYWGPNNDIYYNHRTTGWGTESSYAKDASDYRCLGSVLCDAGDSKYRIYCDGTSGGGNIEENGLDTGYDGDDDYWEPKAALVGTTRYVFFVEPTSHDLHLISNSGAGWVDEGDLLTAFDCKHVICQWSYHNNHQPGHINYVVSDVAGEEPVYFAQFSVAASMTKIMSSILGLSESDLWRAWSVRSMAETVSLAESLLRRMWSVRPFAETLGITDSSVRRASAVRLIAETVGIAETFVKITVTTIVKLMAETLGITEAALRRMWSVRIKAETLGIVDSLFRRLWSIRQMAETISLQDAIVRRMSSVRIKAETISIQDTALKVFAIVKQMAETVGISDAMLKVAGMVRVASETVGIAENWVKFTVSTIVKVMVTETVGLAESTIKRLWATRLMAETVGLTEAALRRLRAVRLITATVALQEALVKRMWSIRQITETVGVSEAGVLRKRFVKIITETIGLVESFVKAVSLYLGIEEIELDSYITRSVEMDSTIARNIDRDSEITRTWEADSHIQ